MKPRFNLRRGVALIIVLSFIVLLAGLLVAFVSRSLLNRQIAASSGGQTRADLLAKMSLDVITGDLRQEIAAGSTVYTTGSVSVFVPSSNRAVIPCPQFAESTTAAVYQAKFPNLIKESSYGVPFYSGSAYAATYAAPNRASNSPTTGTSGNLRSISAARWNAPLLLAKSGTADNTPDATFVAPDWIIVTRNNVGLNASGNVISDADFKGSVSTLPNLRNPVVSNSDYAIGRVAYAIYDEGGLLDINVAGNSLAKADNAKRGRLHQADLSQIPGFSGSTGITNFLNWRSAYTGSNSSAASGSGGLFDPQRDFRSVISSGTAANQSDQTFVGRQDLIKYIKQNPTQFTSDLVALQYLGTFSREKNAPSWCPVKPAGSTIDYAALAEQTTGTNRNLANVRVQKTFLRADGTTSVEDEPLIKQRFPLSRIALLSGSIANPDTDKIKDYFGLTVMSGSSYWTVWQYNHGAADHIYTLDEVKAAGREPDFFELLKAAILGGSLGQSAGPIGGQNSLLGSATEEDDSCKNADAHIIQIGCNSIDQYDEDSYPTVIYFTPPNLTNAVSGAYEPRYYHYGIENLPYLSRINTIGMGPRESYDGTTYDAYPNRTITLFFQPEVWNPHQTSGVGVNAPTVFRIQALGTAWGVIKSGSMKSVTSSTTWVSGTPVITTTINGAATVKEYESTHQDFSSTDDIFNPVQHGYDLGKIQFSAIPDFINPTPLFVENGASSPNNGPNVSGTNDFKGYIGVVAPAASKVYDGKQLVGINCGAATIPDPVMTSSGTIALSGTTPSPLLVSATNLCMGGAIPLNTLTNQTSLSFGMAYLQNGADPSVDSNWHPYSFPVYKLKDRQGASGCSVNQGGYVLADPRTRRFGLQASLADNGFYAGNSLRADTSKGFYTTAYAPTGNTPGTFTYTSTSTPYMGLLSANTTTGVSGVVTYYADMDGIVRPGDAVYGTANGGTYDGCTMAGTPTATTGTESRRHLILNRPFRSVGELGYVFRDLPWKTLDFFTTYSADAPLLDVFSVDDAPVMAGRIDLNTRNKEVLGAMLSGAVKREADPTTTGISSSDIVTTGSSIVGWTNSTDTTKGPLQNRAELVTKLADVLGNLPTATADKANKTHREAAVRALADVANTRTWNLLIDVIAQTGRYPSSATKLEQFVVEGERRYWLHLAIDRYTGEIVDKQLEPVTQSQ